MYTLTRTHAGSAIVALAAILSLAFATPASAWWFGGNSGDDNDIKVSVSNNATVTNTVKVEAETGDNDANGGDGAKGGNGGDATAKRDSRGSNHYFAFWSFGKSQDKNTAGHGGTGGTGGVGGEIYTGNAVSGADVVNVVNRNVTRVTR